jgi:hypothetical protein
MYTCICACICMYPVHITTCAYQFSSCICANCMYLHVSCMHVFFCMYLVCILYVCVCIACIDPGQHSYGHSLAKYLLQCRQQAGPTQSSPGQVPISLNLPSKTPPPDPIWRTPARSTRQAGPTRAQGVANRPPVRIHPSVNLPLQMCPG